MKSKFKVILSTVLCYMILLELFPLSYITAYAQNIGIQGGGTEENPYIVETADDFSFVMSNYGGMPEIHIALENDIEITGFVPGNFSAVFNGNYHKIKSDIHIAEKNTGILKNLYFENTNSYQNNNSVGAFCSVNDGMISNTFVQTQITDAGSAAGISYSGTGSILNCAVFGRVGAYDSDGSTAAGIAYSQGEIANCFVAAEISATGRSRYGTSSSEPISFSGYTDSYFDNCLTGQKRDNGYNTIFIKSADFISVLNKNIQTSDSVWAFDAENKNNGYPILKEAYNAQITSSKTNYVINGTESVELLFEDGVDVYYTTDGSEPDTTSDKYIAPIEISDDIVITAKGYKNGLTGSSYIFKYVIPDGDGTKEHPYLINNETEFKAIAELSPYAYYSLCNDIELNDEFLTFGDFYGVFYGNGHTISNYYSVPNKYDFGLFKNNYGLIENLNLQNADKSIYTNGAFVYKNYGVITGCSFSGNVYGKGDTLYDCYSRNQPYYYGTGGFVSFNYGLINDSVFTGTLSVKNGNTVGGFAGVNDGVIDNCLFSGDVYVNDTFFFGSYTDSNIASGFVGYNTENGNIKNSSAETDTIGIDISSYTGSNIYTFCKGLQNTENCRDIYGLLYISYNYLEWGTVNKNQQNLNGKGYSQATHLHRYSAELTNPTCTQSGEASFLCEECTDLFECGNIPALGHNYTENVVLPTYDSEGYTERICNRCDLYEKINVVNPYVRVDGDCGEGLDFTLDTGTGCLTIYGSGNMTSFSSANMTPWYQYKDLITSIIIEDGVTSVGAYAFSDFSELSSVSISSAAASFGTKCFYNDKKLTYVNYTGNIDEWNGITFTDSTSTPLTYSQKLYICGTEVTDVVLSYGTTVVNPYAFYNLKNISSVVLPETVEKISKFAFYGCYFLENLSMPCSAVIENENSFYNCSRLEKLVLTKGTGVMQTYTYTATPWYGSNNTFTTLVISDGINNISDKAFFGCGKLENITFPKNNYTVGSRAFYGTQWIKNASDENGLYIVGNKLIDAPAASGDVVIPDTVTEISEYALYGNGNITAVTVPDSVETIGDDAFGSGIKKLTIPCSFAGYTEKAFEKCTALTELVMTKGTGSMASFSSSDLSYLNTPWYKSAASLKTIVLKDGITNIGNSAFRNLTNLTSVTIPDTVTAIGKNAFYGDSSLAELVLPDSTETIDTAAFNNCTGLKKLTMPCSAVIAPYLTTFGSCTNIEEITLTKGSGTMPSFYENYKCTPWYISGENLKAFVLEDGITNIGAYMFFGNTNIKNIDFPKSITSIGTAAFNGCTNLEKVDFPTGVTEIGTESFKGCTSLKSVILPDGVTTVKAGAFNGCKALTEVKLSKNLAVIETSSFRDCGIEEIYIPQSVNSIGNYAFYGCSALKKAYVLNEECSISSTNVFPVSLTLYGFDGSTAQTYANKKKITFVICDILPKCGKYDESTKSLFFNESKISNISERVVIKSGSQLNSECKNGAFFGTGSRLYIGDNADCYCTVIIIGDLDGDGVCDVLDVVECERATNEHTILEGAFFAAADANEDEKLDVNDYAAIVNAALA